jgi:hypothetical protein
MNNDKARRSKSPWADLIGEIEEEVKDEALAQVLPNERAMAEVAQQLLRMQRDMLLPGSEQSTADRVKRIGDFIESKEF